MVKMTVKRKLFIVFATVLFLLVVVGSIGVIQINSVDDNYSFLIDDRVYKMNLLKDMMTEVQKMQINARGFLINGDETAFSDYRETIDRYNILFVQLEQIIIIERPRELLFEINQLATDFYIKTEELFKLKREGREDNHFYQLIEETNAIIQKVTVNGNEFIQIQQQLMDDLRAQTHDNVSRARIFIIVISLVAIIIGRIASRILGTVFTRPIHLMANATQEIAAGNLKLEEIKVKNKDEIGEMAASFNQMVANLRELIHQVSVNSQQVSAASEELNASAEQTSAATEHIALSIEQVATGAEQQVQSVAQTSEGINEMSRSIQHIAENAHDVYTTATVASEKASLGNKTTQTAVTQMSSIHRSIDDLGKVIKSLGEQSNRIGEIVQVISDISSQTNLLALNAAIEAARAGEQGRGFAVVADEVRKLAEQSSGSAEQIATLIHSIQEESNKAVESMAKATKEVGDGLTLVTTAGDSFADIQESIVVVTEKVGDVSAAAEQISAATQQMVQSVKVIADVAESSAANTENVSSATEEQLASMEEISASAQALSRMAESLEEVISKFKI